MSRHPLRVGAVSYLNTKPLIAGLADRLASGSCGVRGSLRLDLPSRLATDLAAGRLDVALIPSVEAFRMMTGVPSAAIVSDAAIGCVGPVWSVRLLSRVPIDQIRTLSLDEGSRTSAAMVQILLAEIHGVRPTLRPLPIDAVWQTDDADAALVIGDRAMHPPRGRYREIWDLGDRWLRWTETPFVFAMWVARPEIAADPVLMQNIAALLSGCRDDGLRHVESIAASMAGRQGLTAADLHRYYVENLHFHLGPRQRAGLDLFGQKCHAAGLIDAAPPKPLPMVLARDTNLHLTTD